MDSSGEQRGRAIALVVVRQRAPLQRQPGRGAIRRLNPAFFICSSGGLRPKPRKFGLHFKTISYTKIKALGSNDLESHPPQI